VRNTLDTTFHVATDIAGPPSDHLWRDPLQKIMLDMHHHPAENARQFTGAALCGIIRRACGNMFAQRAARRQSMKFVSFVLFVMTAVGASLLPGRAIANVATDAQDCNQLLDPARAVAGCTRLLKSTGDKSKRNLAIIYQNRGNARGNAGDRDGAIADFSEAIRLNPECGLCYAGRALVWHNKFDYEKAYADFDRALQLEPANPRIYYMRGSVLRDNGEYDRALADAELAIRIAPEDFFAYALRSGIFFDKHDLDRAMADINEAIRLNPRVYMNYNFRGLFWRDKGDYDRAIADFTEAIRLNPGYWTSYANRGEAWRLKGDLEHALADQNRAIQIDPKSATSYVLRDDTYRYRDDFSHALADYDQALNISPDYIPAYTGRGLTYEKMADLRRARDEFEKALASPSQFKADIAKSAIETARAHLAALDSGAAQPVIPAAPSKVTSETSIPTPALAVPAAVPAPAVPEGRRVALVIGNSAYRSVPVLANPQHDAEAVAAVLRAIGFETVTLVDDASRETLVEALHRFADLAEKADWAVVYYAGHGIQMGGLNYLIPIDAKLAVDRDVQFEAVPLEQVLAAVEQAKKLRIVVLDACRGNPFVPQMRRTAAPEAVARAETANAVVGTRSIGRGLGRIEVSGATLVVYSAKDGQTALDGDGADSPFAIAFVQRIATPGVEINKLFRLVRDDVMEAPGRSPTPMARCRGGKIFSL
jgi:tetratricopeptide (TPR) repeat protein